jgi:hypothetical protein
VCVKFLKPCPLMKIIPILIACSSPSIHCVALVTGTLTSEAYLVSEPRNYARLFVHKIGDEKLVRLSPWVGAGS